MHRLSTSIYKCLLIHLCPNFRPITSPHSPQTMLMLYNLFGLWLPTAFIHYDPTKQMSAPFYTFPTLVVHNTTSFKDHSPLHYILTKASQFWPLFSAFNSAHQSIPVDFLRLCYPTFSSSYPSEPKIVEHFSAVKNLHEIVKSRKSNETEQPNSSAVQTVMPTLQNQMPRSVAEINRSSKKMCSKSYQKDSLIVWFQRLPKNRRPTQMLCQSVQHMIDYHRCPRSRLAVLYSFVHAAFAAYDSRERMGKT